MWENDHLRTGGHTRQLSKAVESHIRRMESLTLGGLHQQLGVKRVEETLGEVANAVVHAKHHNQRRRTDSNAGQRNPRNDIDDRLLLAREKVAPRYQQR